MRIFLLGTALIFLFSCKDLKTEENPSVYYDIGEKVSGEIEKMLLHNATLRKEVSLAGEMEVTELTPDSMRWVQELALFASANINKPNNRGLYEESVRADDSSNLTIKGFYHINKEEAMVPELQIYFLDKLENTIKIEMKYLEENLGFRAERILQMSFEEIKGEYLLTGYSVSGTQKIIGMDTVEYQVRASINY